MKASMSSLYFSDLSPSEVVQLFAKHGWRHLELSKGHAHDLITQGDPRQSGETFRQYAADRGITFLQGHLPVLRYTNDDRRQGADGWFDIAPASQEAFARALEVTRKWLELFATMGIRISVLHMGGAALKEAGWSDEAVFERRVEALTSIAAHAANVGVVVCLENMSYPNCGVDTLEQIRTYVAAVDADNVAVCLDTGHAVLAGLDCVKFIHDAGSAIKTLHIHENTGTNDDHVLPYERGSIPWDRVLAALGEIGYAGSFNLEIPGSPWRPMPVREARLDYARALATYMVGAAARSA